MNGYEFKPGDVAMVTTAYTTFPAWKRTGDLWVDEDGVEFELRKGDDWTPRPLVVIDPEDRQQVERLLSAYHAQYSAMGEPSVVDVDNAQHALRSLLAPEKPDEPQGLGAVVEDAEGVTWVRTHNHWRREDLCGADWSAIGAVKVLSEGVQP